MKSLPAISFALITNCTYSEWCESEGKTNLLLCCYEMQFGSIFYLYSYSNKTSPGTAANSFARIRFFFSTLWRSESDNRFSFAKQSGVCLQPILHVAAASKKWFLNVRTKSNPASRIFFKFINCCEMIFLWVIYRLWSFSHTHAKVSAGEKVKKWKDDAILPLWGWRKAKVGLDLGNSSNCLQKKLAELQTHTCFVLFKRNACRKE